MLNKFNSPTAALRFLLSLQPYYYEVSSGVIHPPKGELITIIVNNAYGNLPRTQLQKVFTLLNKYYMLDSYYYSKHPVDHTKRYVLVFRGLVIKLILEYGAGFDYSINELNSLWSVSHDKNLLSKNRYSHLLQNVFEAIKEQEMEHISFSNMDELLEWINFNYKQQGSEYKKLEKNDLISVINTLLVEGLLFLKEKRQS